ncbi:MAG: carbamate kinase [Candidatus Eremiobacteraeota bacterium]|nr:carbamate kinase [Candidatus Eremiobacteraeota bacterium]MCW5869945.1 carbamate kinase [Candidatus Eremiobacteraeota bacterium]
MSGLAVVAVGGNSLIRDKAHQSIPDQYQALVETVAHITDLLEAGWRVVVTHGNGPQVGFVLLRSELARSQVHTIPFDVAVANTQGHLGYHLQQTLHNEFRRRKLDKRAVALLTQVVVAADDPAFQKPTKPIGPFFDEAEARRRKREEGWETAEDSGRGWRRLVASPKPQEIVEIEAIRAMLAAGYVVVAAGGGGIPVVSDEQGVFTGVAAVVDKDSASGLLARQLEADLLVISTAVEKVCLHFGQPEQVELDRVTSQQARQYLEEGHFQAGSMRPKIEAVLAYLEAGGQRALITNPPNLKRALQGQTGTHLANSW